MLLMLTCSMYTKGFTLFEVVIYLALMTLLVSGVIVSGYYIIDAGSFVVHKSRMYVEAVFILERIEKSIEVGEVLVPERNATSSVVVVNMGGGTETFSVQEEGFWVSYEGDEKRALAQRAAQGAALFCKRANYSDTPYDLLSCEISYGGISFSTTLWITE